jgi:hypothetical protein
MVKVVRSDGGSKSFLFDLSEKLSAARDFLQHEKFMSADDAFLNQGAEVDREQEAEIDLSELVANGTLNIGQASDVSPISGDDTAARYNLLRDDQKRKIYDNIQIFRGISITKDGFDKTFRDVYGWDGGYLPDANTPHINTELISNYSFSKVTHDLTVFGSSSASVSFSSSYASGEAEYKQEHSKTTSDSKVTEYLVTRYVVRKALLQVDPAKLAPASGFVDALTTAIHGNEDKLDGYYNLVKVLDEWGYYVPQEFTLGGVIYATDATQITDFSEAESVKQEFSGSFKAEFSGIGGSAAYKEAKGSDSKTTSSTKFQDITMQLIGGKEGMEKDYPGWAKSLDAPIAWALAEAPKLYPTLALLGRADGGPRLATSAIRLIERFSGYPTVQNLQPYLDMGKYNTAVQVLLMP